MEPQQYLQAVRKRLVAVVLIAMSVAGLVAAWTLAQTPVYQSSATVFLSPTAGRTVLDLVQGTNFAQDLVDSYAEIASLPVVVNPVVEELGLTAQDQWSVRAETVVDTVLIEIIATSTDPEQAADVANATARQLGETVKTLSPAAGETGESIEIAIVREAAPSASPAAPRTRRNLAAGVVLGLVLGVAYAIVRDLLDTKIASEDDVAQATAAPVLATVGRAAPDKTGQFGETPRSREAYRRLRTNIDYLNYDNHLRTIMVTSPQAGDGKTTTALALAHRLELAGKRVLFIDADLHHGSSASRLGLVDSVGLSTVLTGRMSLDEALQPTAQPGLWFLASGETPPNSSELLGSPRMQRLLEEETSTYDYVILDSPPTLPITDPAVIAQFCHGVVVVVRYRKTTRAALAQTARLLELAEVRDAKHAQKPTSQRIVGVVINAAKASSLSKDERYGYYGKEPELAPQVPKRSPASQA